MTAIIKKPFYLRPPLNVLFDRRKLLELAPWDVNVAFLLATFLKQMEESGQIDFRASGAALNSSALIYLMKSKLLLEHKEQQSPKAQQDFLPPPIPLPFRHGLTSTTIQHLLEALDAILRVEKNLCSSKAVKAESPLTALEILPQPSSCLMNVELQMEELYGSLVERVKGAGIIEFSALVKGMKRLNAVRTFILLLFLAQRGKVNLLQDEESGEIYIVLGT